MNNLNKFSARIFICVILLSQTSCLPEAAGAGGSWFNQDRRSSTAIVDDQAISIKANLAIAKNRAVWKDSHISTLSYNNSLLLVGQTKSPVHKQEIEKSLEPISEIGTIFNQITISNPISLKDRANDTWITTQVKARLIASRDIGINRVKVITEDGTVYVMGRLTKDEENIALDLARRIKGVEKVVAVIERDGIG